MARSPSPRISRLPLFLASLAQPFPHPRFTPKEANPTLMTPPEGNTQQVLRQADYWRRSLPIPCRGGEQQCEAAVLRWKLSQNGRCVLRLIFVFSRPDEEEELIVVIIDRASQARIWSSMLGTQSSFSFSFPCFYFLGTMAWEEGEP
jgi:hypothetical protein